MKRQNQIVDLFRRNQHKLNESPSAQAWNRLERRLDQKGRRNDRPTASVYRLFMMVAAAIALIFFVATLADIAHVTTNEEAVVIHENAPVEKTFIRQLTAEQAFREEYVEQLSKSVEEGTVGRLLVANKAVRPFLIPKKS